MKKLNKVALSLGMAGALLAGGISADAASPVNPGKSHVINPGKPGEKRSISSHFQSKFSHKVGVVIGFADNNSFEIKTSEGYMVIRLTHPNQHKMIKEGKLMVFTYYTNKYGQNILFKAYKK